MTRGGNRQVMGVSQRADTQPVFQSFMEPHMGVSSLDPISKAIGNFLLVAGAIALVCTVAVSIPLAVFLMMFASF